MEYNDLFMNQDLSSAEKVSWYVVRVANAFQDLLARAEAAEEDRDRMREAMKPNCLLCDSMHENGNCTEVGGFCTAVPAAHCPLIPRLRNKLAAVEARAEKAERERDAAISDLTYIARTYPVDLCDDLVCQYCKHYQNVNTGCPGWTENDCFEWSGKKEE